MSLNERTMAALELWKLASQQLYSRFSAMLVANSILLTIIGLSFTDTFTLDANIRIWIIWAGIVVCIAWIIFMVAGWKVESHYRKEFENDEGVKELTIKIGDWRSISFLIGIGITISVFLTMYFFLLSKTNT